VGADGSSRVQRGVVVRSRVISRVEELTDRTAAAQSAPCVLSPVGVRGSDLRVAFDGLTVDTGVNAFPFATTARTHLGGLGLFFVCGPSPWGHVNGHPLTTGLVYVSGPGARTRAAVPSGVRVATIAFDVAGLDEATVEARRGKGVVVRSSAWDVFSEQVTRLVRGTKPGGTLALDADAIASMRARLVDAVVQVAGEADEPLELTTTQRSTLEIIEQAEAYARARRYQSVTIAELCDAVGASERRLRYAFTDSYGMSPTAYLRVRALHSARERLSQGDVHQTVTQTATDFGFWHLGRFSGQYRTLFGESPSDTLAQARPAAERRAG
jgi:AraC-like DNA-binding protein